MSERDWTPSSTSPRCTPGSGADRGPADGVHESELPPVVGPDRDHIETVREAWTSYVAAAYPDEPLGTIRRRELRRAFYMGSWAMMVNLATAIDRDEAASDKEMIRLWDEVSAFVDQVRAGRA